MKAIRKGQRFTHRGIRFEATSDEQLDSVAAVMVPSSIHSPAHWVRLSEVEPGSVADTKRSKR